jgi:hypothetical protein
MDDDALVEAMARAIAEIEVCGNLDGCPSSVCECRIMARAARAIAVPVVVERCVRRVEQLQVNNVGRERPHTWEYVAAIRAQEGEG